jgi:hypothetical protein
MSHAFSPGPSFTQSATSPDGSARSRDVTERGLDAESLSARDWILVPQTIGVLARVAVWCGIFALLLLGLFTYPAVVIGVFLCVALLTRYVWRKRP